MLILKETIRRRGNKLKTITFRLEKELVEEFQSLTKEVGLKQATIIRVALDKAIEEMKKIKETNNGYPSI